MASITGGNTLVIATIALGVMFVLLVALLLPVFGLGDYLSISLSGVTERQAQETVEPEIAVTERSIDAEEARQLLGFIEYPVVQVQPSAVNIFAPEAQEDTRRLSEEEIQQRCAFISIRFNRDRCVQAERLCAQSITSDQEHWACLNSHDFWIGKKLSYTGQAGQ